MSFEHCREVIQELLAVLERIGEQSIPAKEKHELIQIVQECRNWMKRIEQAPTAGSESVVLPRSDLSLPARPLPSLQPFGEEASVVTSAEGVIGLVDLQGAQWFQDEKGDSIGKSLSTFLGESDWTRISRFLEELHREAKHWSGLVRLVPGNGRPPVADCHISGLQDARSQVLALHWRFRRLAETPDISLAGEFAKVIQEQVFSGLSLQSTLQWLCQRFVDTFRYPFVWVGIRQQPDGLQVGGFARDRLVHLEPDSAIWSLLTDSQAIPARAMELKRAQGIHEGDLKNRPGWEDFYVAGVRSGVAIPLMGRNQAIGVLTVFAFQEEAFSSEVTRWLEKIAEQMALAVLLAKEYGALRLREAAFTAVEYPVCVTDLAGHLVWMNDAYRRIIHGGESERLGTALPAFPFNQISTYLKRSKTPHVKGQHWRTEFVEKRDNGMVRVYEQVLTPLTDEQGKVTNFVAVLEDITDRRKTEEEMEYRASHDPLTDLPNRIMFHDRLAQAVARAKRQGRFVSVMYLDLDGFKAINDDWGHGVGDRVLQTVAHRFRECIRATDTVARLSGDEFALILQDLERTQDTHRVAQKILQKLAQPISLDGERLSVGASIGIALFPVDAADPQGLLECADRAMYEAKRSGGQRCRYASEHLNRQFSSCPPTE